MVSAKVRKLSYNLSFGSNCWLQGDATLRSDHKGRRNAPIKAPAVVKKVAPESEKVKWYPYLVHIHIEVLKEPIQVSLPVVNPNTIVIVKKSIQIPMLLFDA